MDSEQKGYVSIAQWAEVIGSTLSLHLPWINLQVRFGRGGGERLVVRGRVDKGG